MATKPKKKVATKALVVIPTRKERVARIRAAQSKSLEGVLEVGRELIDAKEGPQQLPHGQFEAMVEEDLHMSSRMAQMLMKIAAHPVLSKANHGSHLPAAWRTLYELSRVPNLEAKIKDGTINAMTERKDVTPLIPAKKKKKIYKPVGDDPEETEEETPKASGLFSGLGGDTLKPAKKKGAKVRMQPCPHCGGSGQIEVEGDF